MGVRAVVGEHGEGRPVGREVWDGETDFGAVPAEVLGGQCANDVLLELGKTSTVDVGIAQSAVLQQFVHLTAYETC